MTAISSASNTAIKNNPEGYHSGRENQLIIIMEIQPETVMTDEDDVTYTTRAMPSPYPSRVGAHTHEYSALQLYQDYLNNDPEFKKWQDEYVDVNLNHFADANPEVELHEHNALIETYFGSKARDYSQDCGVFWGPDSIAYRCCLGL